ncbi:MAG: hypothetical protein Q8Q33_10005 [Chlamydiota bacterium]|nr:hypothetical protein [Chlamydiota bacterium]
MNAIRIITICSFAIAVIALGLSIQSNVEKVYQKRVDFLENVINYTGSEVNLKPMMMNGTRM